MNTYTHNVTHVIDEAARQVADREEYLYEIPEEDIPHAVNIELDRILRAANQRPHTTVELTEDGWVMTLPTEGGHAAVMRSIVATEIFGRVIKTSPTE